MGWGSNDNPNTCISSDVGDDINCFELLSNVGIAACPENAINKIKSIPNIILLKSSGGEGAFREFAELYL